MKSIAGRPWNMPFEPVIDYSGRRSDGDPSRSSITVRGNHDLSENIATIRDERLNLCDSNRIDWTYQFSTVRFLVIVNLQRKPYYSGLGLW